MEKGKSYDENIAEESKGSDSNNIPKPASSKKKVGAPKKVKKSKESVADEPEPSESLTEVTASDFQAYIGVLLHQVIDHSFLPRIALKQTNIGMTIQSVHSTPSDK